MNWTEHANAHVDMYLYRHRSASNEPCLLFLPRDKHIQWWNTQLVGNDQYIIVADVL